MDVQYGPNSVDEPNLLYKLQRKIKVFNTNNSLPNRGYNLVASCSKYGIVFIVAPNCTLSAYYLKDLIDKECEPQHITLNLQAEPTHISINCDQEWLAVISKTMLLVYKIMDFQNQNISHSVSIKLDVNPSTFVSAVQWNPCIPDTIAIAFFDGTLLVSQITTMQVKKRQTSARCICWSPKGKQIVTGNSEGTLCQYKPDLSPMKTILAPNLFEGAPVEALAIFWISTYQFAVVYKNVADNVRPAVTIVNTPKGGQPTCYNYDDICYSIGSNRPWYYYLHGLPQWNLILTSSSNSMEIATLGSADGANWLQLCPTDEARPELPLTDKKQENYPIGLSIDTCAIHQLPWGENETLPPMPLLHVLSQTGLLSIFNMINLKKDAVPVCTPPQLLTLPANIMSSNIPDDVPQVAAIITSAPAIQSVPQAVQPSPIPSLMPVQPQSKPQPAPSPLTQFSQSFSNVNTQVYGTQKSQVPQGLFSASTPHIAESKPVETKPQIPVAQKAVPLVQPKAAIDVSKTQSPAQTQEINAALKSEQERLNKIKANEELKNMLIKEINDFQLELYMFMETSKDAHMKLQRDIEVMGYDFKLRAQDIKQLTTDCSIEELRESVVMLKLELVRVCALIAEARTYAETKHLQNWCPTDPLTSKRVATIKKLAYYVKNQIDQAHKVLDHKWNEMMTANRNDKPGQSMLRPILDDIYQPLVKQQEIIGRQQAVLRTLRNTLKECGDILPMFKSTSILRNTPLKEKADPLSKLTKNILNMSIDPELNKVKKPMLSNQKLEALRDMLSNHKTVKIKPVGIERRQRFEALQLNYEKSKKEKLAKEKENNIQTAKNLQPETLVESSVKRTVKPEKSELKIDAQAINIPTYTPVGNIEQAKPMNNVARTLFTEDSDQVSTKVPSGKQPEQVPPKLTVNPEEHKQTSGTVTSTTRNLLKDMLQNKSQANAEANNDSNTFIVAKTPTTIAAPAAALPSKPIADINNLFDKIEPLSLPADLKSPIQNANAKSSETGEPEGAAVPIKNIDNKPLTNVFSLKPTTPLAAVRSQNVPDILKTSTQAFTISKVDNKNKTEATINVKDKGIAKLKENIPEKESEKVSMEPSKQIDDKKVESKPLSLTNKPVSFVSTAQPVTQISAETKVIEVKHEPIHNKTDVTEKTSSIFNTSAALTVIRTTVTPTTTVADEPASTEKKPESRTTPSASSVFGTAVASQKTSVPEIKPSSPTGSIFAPSDKVFGSINIFGTSTASTTTVASTATAQSIFSSAVSSTPFTPPTSTPASVTPKTTVESEPPVDSAPVISTPTISTPATVAPSAASAIFTAQTPASVFSTSKDPAVTDQSLFATPTSEPVFAPTSSNQSIFNTATPTPLFGTTPTTTQSAFATATTTTSTFWNSSSQNWGFANANQPVFAGVTTQSSLFGTPTPSTQASAFGTPTQTTPNVFASTAPTSQPSLFGTPPATGSSSLFGGGEANLFAAATISTTKASSPTSGGSIFEGSSTGSLFSGGSTNVFGVNQSAASIFSGANSTFKQQNTSTNFWSGGSTTANPFASPGFAQQATTQASMFGGSTGGSFSAPSTGQPLGSPQAGAQAFGVEAKPFIFSTPQQQSTPAFGGSPVFGSKPVFGQTASFGSPTGFGGGFNKSPGGGFGAPATFGGAPAFGSPAFGNTSPGKVFGGTSPTSGFGAPTQSNSTFESLATQNTLTFGNLAQQSAQQTQPQPGFNTSPSFTGWRG